MATHRAFVFACHVATLLFTATASAADKKETAFLDPEKAGPDFRVQGEYVGTVGGVAKIAAQVIALGDGKFEGTVYAGGLPGDGWDEKVRFAFRGQTEGSVTRFEGTHGERLMYLNENFHGEIRGDAFTGEAWMFRNVVDDARFTLKKVHRTSPTLGAEPPKGAIALFDGSGVTHWVKGRLAEGDLLNVGTETVQHFRSVFLHLEFRTPFMPYARGMSRGNGGVYLKKDWEVQVLDSFGWNTNNRKFERLSGFGRCGGIHEFVKPRINMCLPPLSWQTYDIEFTVAEFDDAGKKVVPAMLTVRHNGVLIHDRVVLPRRDAERDRDTDERAAGPVYLQDHGNPVRFRNVWVMPK